MHDAEYNLLIQLYCFGEKYLDIRLKNAAIDAIIAKSQIRDVKGYRWFPSGREVDTLYKGTCAGSLARKLMVDMHVKEGVMRRTSLLREWLVVFISTLR